ncbi:ABC transporter ATP-binding protein [Luteimonas sp. 8-5]|uniref:ABC transporter ATP-binding protein n=1 Tax=Luteimonas sp. 8-5 TaxID=3039387 RepID=UPI002436674D|nr:ABC transporter ATP-binding protein [Luteimonas sp. 8-5]MDG6349231.1 ABC transporter ATP-binding protein [Luteimonas sp. 8-5]
MQYDLSSTEGGRATLRAFASTLPRGDRLLIVAHAVASLLAAFAGSLAALLLVPLIQPVPVLAFGDGVFSGTASLEARAGLFAAATALFALSRWSAACLGARLSARYGMRLRQSVHARMVGARLSALADSTSAEIANVLTYNIEIIVHGFSAVLQLLVALLTTVVTLAFAFRVSPPLMLALPVFAGFAWMAARLFGREQSRISRDYVANMTRLFWRAEDFPRRLRHVRSFGRQHDEHASYVAMTERLGHGYRRQLELGAHGRLLLELVATVTIAVAFVLAQRWNGVDPAQLIALCLLLGRLLPYLASTRQGIQQLRSAIPAFDLWRRYMALEAQPPAPAMSPMGHGAGHSQPILRIRTLRLPSSLVRLEVRDLVLAPGELTLVCGDSGIGKSCLVDVLAGLMVPASFEGDSNGMPIDFDDYRARAGRNAYVSQQVRPWHASVRECLLWAAPAATEAAMQRALADVGLDKRLGRSPAGLDTTLQGSASQLSGGELQRLMLAQVLLREPALAILDEATSALDTVSEREVLALLRRRLPHAALVVVSHRTALASMAGQTVEIRAGGAVVVRRRQVRPGMLAGTSP